MKKIAYVMTHFPVLSETFISTEIRAMEGCGHSIQPIAFNHYDGLYQQRDQSLKDRTLYLCDYPAATALKALKLLKTSAFAGLRFALAQQGLTVKSLLGNALKLAWLAKQNGCDHFHAHFAQGGAATAIVAARLCGATVSFVGHGYDIYATPQDLKLKLNNVDFSVAVCLDMAHYFNQLAPKGDTALVYCGVDIERFQTTELQSNIMAQGNDKKMLFIGRLCETKGLFTLLNALKLIDAQQRPVIDMVGDGILRTQLENYVESLGLSNFVNFLGAKQSSWLIENSQNYSAAILPFEMADNGDRDTGPVVVKEAMSLKLPVITTYFMGCKEMVTEDTGLRAEPANPESLADAIKRFYDMGMDEINQMVDEAYERVTTHYNAELQALCLSSKVQLA